MRHHLGRFGAVVLVIMLGLAVVGCSSRQSQAAPRKAIAKHADTKKALGLVAASKKNYGTFRKLQAEIDSSFDNMLDNIPEPPEGTAQRQAVIQEIDGKMKEQRTEMLNAIGELEKSAGMDISSDFSEYLRLLTDFYNKEIEATDASLKLNETWAKVYDPDIASKTTKEALDEEYVRWNTQQHNLHIDANGFKYRADKFFKKKKL